MNEAGTIFRITTKKCFSILFESVDSQAVPMFALLYAPIRGARTELSQPMPQEADDVLGPINIFALVTNPPGKANLLGHRPVRSTSPTAQ